MNSALRAHGSTQMWIPFLDGGSVGTGSGTMQHHSGSPTGAGVWMG